MVSKLLDGFNNILSSYIAALLRLMTVNFGRLGLTCILSKSVDYSHYQKQNLYHLSTYCF